MTRIPRAPETRALTPTKILVRLGTWAWVLTPAQSQVSLRLRPAHLGGRCRHEVVAEAGTRLVLLVRGRGHEAKARCILLHSRPHLTRT